MAIRVTVLLASLARTACKPVYSLERPPLSPLQHRAASTVSTTAQSGLHCLHYSLEQCKPSPSSPGPCRAGRFLRNRPGPCRRCCTRRRRRRRRRRQRRRRPLDESGGEGDAVGGDVRADGADAGDPAQPPRLLHRAPPARTPRLPVTLEPRLRASALSRVDGPPQCPGSRDMGHVGLPDGPSWTCILEASQRGSRRPSADAASLSESRSL